MEIFVDRVPYKKYPRFKWRDGNRLIIFLYGINIVWGDPIPYIEPVYRSLISFQTGLIETPWFIIYVFRSWPFIHIERPRGIKLEDE